MPEEMKRKENEKTKDYESLASYIWKELQNGRNYKTSNNLFKIIERNERFYAGDHWKGINAKNLSKVVYNFIAQLVDVKVSSVMANLLTISRKAEALDKDNGPVQKAARAFELADKTNWERLNMDALNEEILLDAALSGISGTYWFWDKDIKTGNTFVHKGDFMGEAIDAAQIYVSNPNERDIQKQDWVMLSVRKTIKQLRDLARAKGVPEHIIESINGDKNSEYDGYDKSDEEQTGLKQNANLGTLNIKFWKEKEKGKTKVYFAMSTSNVTIMDKTDSGLTRYPIAIMTWKPRKRYFFGEAEVTHIIANQMVANKQEAIRHLHALLMGIPKVGINKNVISGFTNAVGAVHEIDMPPNYPISNAISYFQPTAMTGDVDKSINEAISRTMDIHGVNQNILGAARPENAQAQLTQIKQSNIPLESIRRRFYTYNRDVALIWLDFYQHKYNLLRKYVDEETGEVIDFKGTDMADVYLKTAIDVGPSTQWSEIVQLQTLNDVWDRGILQDSAEYVKRLPDNLLNMQEEMVDFLGGGEDNPQKQAMFELMAFYLQQQAPEVQAQIQALPPEEQEKAMINLVLANAELAT